MLFARAGANVSGDRRIPAAGSNRGCVARPIPCSNAMERRAFVIVLTEPALLLSNRCHVDSDGAGLRAILPAVARQVRDFGVRDLILARHAGDVRTGAANPASLHDGRLSSGLRHVPSHKLPGCTAAKNENFKLL